MRRTKQTSLSSNQLKVVRYCHLLDELILRDCYVYQHFGVSKERDTSHELGSHLLHYSLQNGNWDLNRTKHSFNG